MAESNGNGSTPLQGLDADFITKLMQGSRSKNVYGPKLAIFMESDEAAINPAEVWPLEFGGEKKASTLYQGFLTAAKAAKIQDQILIKQSDDSCFILHKERVAGLLTVDA
jgi:hypothetical protein